MPKTEPWILVVSVGAGVLYFLKALREEKAMERRNHERFSEPATFAPGAWSVPPELRQRVPRKTIVREESRGGLDQVLAEKAAWRESLLQSGIPVEALITKVYATRTGRSRLTSRYEALDIEYTHGGQKLRKSDVLISRGLAEAGKSLTILVNPQDPNSVCVYPDEHYRVLL